MKTKPSRDYQNCWMLVFWRISFSMLFSCCTEKRCFISYEILACSVKCFTILLKYNYHYLIKQYIGVFLMVRFVKSLLYLRSGNEDNICLCFCVMHLVCSCACQEAHDFLPSFQPCLAYFEDFVFICIPL